ncbi:hypothetical protein CEUSTIGMA_g9478.t1 [Chlamydomonas eustigma]|uniref:Uncharacterized protein n=1 Tax=Chlamydomonas eustigma TaxID=1157962 RepID=A0A250XGY3_9CHLO|nr:hypothetical protein CEUSTIGMA_g9478.t1 [Chlamydomonas eustigma]|eukprot:GAX82050.1 hypothetical protein CEUSTIGMA_g9478.t1 [Chlamydomonas eustigma]
MLQGDHAGEYSLLEEDARGKALNQGAVQQFPPPPPIPQGGVPGQAGGLMGMPRTVEEALAIIEQYKSRNVKSKRKSKKKEKKGKKERKDKKAKKQKKQKVSSSSGSSDSGSE